MTLAIVNSIPDDGRYSLGMTLATLGPEVMQAMATEGAVLALVYDTPEWVSRGSHRLGRGNDGDPP